MTNWKKGLKYVLITAFTLVALLLIVISIALNFIYTPEKITPVVVAALNKNLNARVGFKSVELTFFSSFPNFSLRLKEGTVVKPLPSTEGSIHSQRKRDTLVSFKRCLISLDPIAFLSSEKVRVNALLFDTPDIYAYVNKEGAANWDILKTTTADFIAEDSATTTSDADINIKRIRIKNGRIVYDNEKDSVLAKLDGFNIQLNGFYKKDSLNMVGETSTGKAGYWLAGQQLELQGVEIKLQASYLQKVAALQLTTKADTAYFSQAAQQVALKDFNLNLDANSKNKITHARLLTEAKGFHFSNEGKKLVDNVTLTLVAEVDRKRSNREIKVHNAKVGINNVQLSANGTLMPDSVRKVLGMDLKLSLDVPSLTSLMALIPTDIVDQKKELESKGRVFLQCDVKGVYGKDSFPIVKSHLQVAGGSFHYKDMPGKVDFLDTELNAFLDYTRKEANVNVTKFNLKGTGVDLQMTGVAKNLFSDPLVSSDLKGKVNFSKIMQVIPFQKGIVLEGIADVNLNSAFKLSDITNNNYGLIKAKGNVALDYVKLQHTRDSFYFKTDSSYFRFGNNQVRKLSSGEEKEVFGGRVKLTNTVLKYKKQIDATVSMAEIGFGSTTLRDTSQIANMVASVKVDKLKLSMDSALRGGINHADAKITVKPSDRNKKVAVVHVDFKIDSSGMRANGNFIRISNGNYSFDLYRRAPKQWNAKGSFTFNNLTVYSPAFPMPLKFEYTQIGMSPRTLELTNAKLKAGKSDMELTGKIYDFKKTLLNREQLKAELTIRSKLIDCNELISALNRAASQTAPVEEELLTATTAVNADTALAEFVVPKGLDLTFKSSIEKVLFDNLELNNVRGSITVKDQEIHLNRLRMKTKAADMKTSLRYTAKDSADAHMDFDFGLTNIEMKELVSLFPALDTLFPMSKSFEGKVRFSIQGETRLNKQLEVVFPSFKAVSAIEGEDLVLLDGETFRKLAKTLMFKHKDRNVIDSLSFEMIIENGQMEVFPSVLTVDRYKVAVGGVHKLDMNYNYHISILQSPMPFKAGVDVFGNLDDYDYKITQAKYKYLFSDKKRHQEKADSSIIKKKMAILQRLKF